jgi:ketol-acid reductoisomerase
MNNIDLPPIHYTNDIIMTARLFYDKDCSLEPLAEKTVVFLGYGNQGRAQALNLRDTFKAESGLKAPKIIIANNQDSYAETAKEDGFDPTTSWTDAAAQADVLFLLVPDEVRIS